MQTNSWLKRLFIPEDVLAVVWSLDNEPEEWTPFTGFSDKPYSLTHKSGLYVWAENRAYGVAIRESHRGRLIFGGVGNRSSFGLSPGHWALSNAIGRWIARRPLLQRSARQILADQVSA